MHKVLLVDDDLVFRKAVDKLLNSHGYSCQMAATLQEGMQCMNKEHFDIVFLDVILPDGNGLQEINSFQNASSNPQVIVITAQGDPDNAAAAVEAGAWDYLEKPISIPKIRLVLQRAIRYREQQDRTEKRKLLFKDKIIGKSTKLVNCLQEMAKASESSSNVLLTGETGTGKELFARTLHQNSPRAERNFVVVDCTALPDNLAESLLFGHYRGSFTGAHESRPGLIKQADKGTLFLDEVGELPLSIQKILLRALQERSFRPLGSKTEEKSDFRLIAATNRDLRQMVRDNEFRSDLFFRIWTNRIDLPPLRERLDDIKILAKHFISQICEDFGVPVKTPSQEFIRDLQQYYWPGNVRELQNSIYVAVENAYSQSVLLPQHLPVEIRAETIKSNVSNKKPPSRLEIQECTAIEEIMHSWNQLPAFKEARRKVLQVFEENYLRSLTACSQGNIRQACQISGLSRARLYELLKKHGVNIKEAPLAFQYLSNQV